MRTVNRGLEILKVQQVFPKNLFIKTYVSLCESCRAIVPLQLLFLEIFKLVVTFWSLAFSNMGK
jgi:hypothetical protein